MYASDLSFDHCICMCDHYDLVFGERAAVRRLSGTCANLSADLLAFEIPMQSQLRGAENGTMFGAVSARGSGLPASPFYCRAARRSPGAGHAARGWARARSEGEAFKQGQLSGSVSDTSPASGW